MINTAKELNKALKDTSVAKEYLKVKEDIFKDEYVNSLLEVIKQTQNEAKQALSNNDLETYKIKNATLNLLKEEFINLPIVANYIVIKNDVYSLLEQVVNILSE